MSRAEMRRLQREQKKSETVTYNLTKAQLDAMVNEKFRDELRKVKKKATEDAVRTAMTLMLTLPLEVLIDHYWQKSCSDRIRLMSSITTRSGNRVNWIWINCRLIYGNAEE